MEVRGQQECETPGNPGSESASMDQAARLQLCDLPAHRVADAIVIEWTGKQQHSCGQPGRREHEGTMINA